MRLVRGFRSAREGTFGDRNAGVRSIGLGARRVWPSGPPDRSVLHARVVTFFRRDSAFYIQRRGRKKFTASVDRGCRSKIHGQTPTPERRFDRRAGRVRRVLTPPIVDLSSPRASHNDARVRGVSPRAGMPTLAIASSACASSAAVAGARASRGSSRSRGSTTGARVVTRRAARASRGSIATAAARGTDDRARDVDPSASASASVPRRDALALGAALALTAGFPLRASADDAPVDILATATIDDATVAVLDAPAAAPAVDPDPVVGDVRLVRYVDETSGYAVRVPEGWVRDQPMANTPEFHPRSEYGGRRFRVTVTPVGRVPGGGNRLASLAESDLEEVAAGGFQTPETFAATEAAKFAPVKGDEGAKGGPGSATSEIVSARASPDGRYYYYEYRVDSIYPLRFWGVAAIGPGQVGGARKLARRDVVQVTCQMPEDKAAPEDFELLRAVVDTFRVDDF